MDLPFPVPEFADKVDFGRLLVAVGLTIWLGGVASAATYVRRRARFPKSMYAGILGNPARSSAWFVVIPGLITFGFAAYTVPDVAWGIALLASGLVTYGLAVYVVALSVERRRAIRLGLPEPGTAGTVSLAEFAAFLAFALAFAAAALGLTVDGIAHEFGGNRGDGVAELGVAAGAWLITFFMGLFASPLLILRGRRQVVDEPDAPAHGSSL